MDIRSVKQWLRLRPKHYKHATSEYLARMQEALEQSTRRKLLESEARSVGVIMKDSADTLFGFKVDRIDFPGLTIGELIRLIRVEDNKHIADGRIVDFGADGVKIKLISVDRKKKGDSNKENDLTTIFRIEFDKQDVFRWKKQIEYALHKVRFASCSPPIYKCLLGNYNEWSNTKFDRNRLVLLDKLTEPSDNQKIAIEQCMKKRISLVEGGAGSGKTLIAACIASSTSQLRGRKILLCSPLQATVDKLSHMLNQTELSVVQIPIESRTVNQGRLRVKQKSADSGCLLDALVEERIYWRCWDRYRNILEGSHKPKVLMHDQAQRMTDCRSEWLDRKISRKLLKQADVVCCTLLQAGSNILKGIKFDMLIIDDAHMSTEVECLVPIMMKGIKQVTLLSEMRKDIRLNRSQVSTLSNGKTNHMPTIGRSSRQKRVSRKEIEQAQELGGLFERWLSMGITTVALKYQFRMHETLARFPNHHFYLSRLKNDLSSRECLSSQVSNIIDTHADEFKFFPFKECLTALMNISGEKDSVIETIDKLIGELKSVDVHESSIAVITNTTVPIISLTQAGVQFGTTVDFAGLEWDFIIVLGLENENSDENSSYNFLTNDNALNIAITRAKLGMIILANIQDMDSKLYNYCESWKKLVNYYRTNKMVIQ